MKPSEAEKLAEELVGQLGRRWRHVQGVAATAERLVCILPAEDRETVVTAAWLHDIGYSPSLIESGLHPIDGARFLRLQAELDPQVVSLVAHHTGAVYEAEERGLAAELSIFPEPRADLLQVVTAADVLTGPDGSAVDPSFRIDEILRRYPPDNPVHRAVSRSGPLLVRTAVGVRERAESGQ